MAKLTQTIDIDSIPCGQLATKYCELDSHETLQHVLNTSTVAKKLQKFQPHALEESDGKRFVLIEGCTKSFLLKHIACQWEKKLMLTIFKIVLLVFLCDPNIYPAGYISLQSFQTIFCKGDPEERAKEIVISCSDFILASNGNDVTFLLNGYDEFPDNLKRTAYLLIFLIEQCYVLFSTGVS